MRRSQTIFVVIGWLAVAAFKTTPSAPAPDLRAGDAWVMVGSTETHVGNQNGFHQNRNRLTLTNIEGDRLQITAQAVGSPLAPHVLLRGRDLSNYVSIDGIDTLSAQPMNFPLSVGNVGFETTTPDNRKFAWIRYEREYSVVDYAPVTVAAGTFQAFKIEMNGHWRARIAPGVETLAHMRSDGGGNTVSVDQERARAGAATGGRLYSVIWYAPAVKHWIKLTEETYGSAGVLSEKDEAELERFEPASPSSAGVASSR